MLLNGYAIIPRRYLAGVTYMIPFIASGRIDEKLLTDLLTSILDGEADYGELLKMQLLIALSENLEDEQSGESLHFPYFEKQVELSQRADNANESDSRLGEETQPVSLLC